MPRIPADYQTVAQRIFDWHGGAPTTGGSIETEVITIDLVDENGLPTRLPVVRATVSVDGKRWTAHSRLNPDLKMKESQGGPWVHDPKWFEKAEGVAVGRALAHAGFPTKGGIDGDASSEPAARHEPAEDDPSRSQQLQNPGVQQALGGITDAQRNAIDNLNKRLGEPPVEWETTPMSREEASALIQNLQRR